MISTLIYLEALEMSYVLMEYAEMLFFMELCRDQLRYRGGSQTDRFPDLRVFVNTHSWQAAFPVEVAIVKQSRELIRIAEK